MRGHGSQWFHTFKKSINIKKKQNPKQLPGFFVLFNILIFIYFFKYETISTFAPTFWTHIISELGGVISDLHKYTLWKFYGTSTQPIKFKCITDLGILSFCDQYI